MRLPRSPGYGGRSRPGASRFRTTHWTLRATGNTPLIEQRSIRQLGQQRLDRSWQADARRIARVIPEAPGSIHYTSWALAASQQRRHDQVEVRKRMLDLIQMSRMKLSCTQSLLSEHACCGFGVELRQAP